MTKPAVNSSVSAKRDIARGQGEQPKANSPRSKAKPGRCASPENHRSCDAGSSVLTTATYLDELNPEQRRAVEHGVRQGCTVAPPLLVIAGAGSGKTNTLAHRVAHLIVNGADPGRILLMTFSRRA